MLEEQRKRIDLDYAIKEIRKYMEQAEKDHGVQRDLLYANYLMIHLLLNRQAAEDAEFRAVLDGYRGHIERLALDKRVDEIRIEQIQVTGEAEDTPETDKPKRKRKK